MNSEKEDFMFSTNSLSYLKSMGRWGIVITCGNLGLDGVLLYFIYMVSSEMKGISSLWIVMILLLCFLQIRSFIGLLKYSCTINEGVNEKNVVMVEKALEGMKTYFKFLTITLIASVIGVIYVTTLL